MASNKEKTYTFEGEINGNSFKQIVTVPPDDGSGTNTGGAEGAGIYKRVGTVVLFGPVIYVDNSRSTLQRKK